MEDERLYFEACNKDRAVDMINYSIKLSRDKYCDIETEAKKTLLMTHRHFKECEGCRKGYCKLKGELATSEKLTGLFSGSDFKILRENERELEKLIHQD